MRWTMTSLSKTLPETMEVKPTFLTPGKTKEIGYVERFNGRFRDEC